MINTLIICITVLFVAVSVVYRDIRKSNLRRYHDYNDIADRISRFDDRMDMYERRHEETRESVFKTKRYLKKLEKKVKEHTT